MKWIFCSSAALLINFTTFSQNHFGAVSGVVSFRGIRIAGATITLKDNGTGIRFSTRSNASGTYGLYQLSPASQYQLTVHYPEADTLQIQSIQIIAGEDLHIHLPLQPSVNILTPLTIKTNAHNKSWRNGITILSEETPNSPHWGNLFLHEPSATVKNDGSGALSFSGQKYRSNAFYIDGVLQNDPFGLSPSGILNGENGQGPVAMESIEQITLSKNPYDASLGNFTGAVVQVVTQRGSNLPRQEIYFHSKANYQQYNHTGINLSGPVKRNTIFFFLNTEFLSSRVLFPYDSSYYEGETRSVEKLNRFRQTMMEQFSYDPGIPDQLATYRNNKISLRMDAEINKQNRLSLTLRWNQNYREQAYPPNARILTFSNNIKRLEQQQVSISLEWNKKVSGTMQNRLSLYFNQHHRNTLPKIQGYPTIRILDGEGMIVVGANEESYQNVSQQRSIQLINRLHQLLGRHFLEAGIDLQYHELRNNFIPNGHGSYFYYSISDLVQNRRPAEFSINQIKGGATAGNFLSAMHLIRKALFLNYKTSINNYLHIQAGIRLQKEYFINPPETDSFTQAVAIPIVGSYYHSGPLYSGKLPRFNWSIAPRIQWIWRIPRWNSILKIGTGIFIGTIPNAWLSGIQSNNGNKIAAINAKGSQLNAFYFTPPSYNGTAQLPLNYTETKGAIYLSSESLKLPAIWRTNFSWEQKINPSLSLEMEFLYYLQNTETGFTNINITKPNYRLSGADQRWIYHPNMPHTIHLQPNSDNPYQQILLIHNKDSIKSRGYQMQLQLFYNKEPIRLILSYSYGKSYALFDGNYSNTLHYWRLQENINGRNNPALAISDFSQGHRIHATIHWQSQTNRKQKTRFSLHYTGQQGKRFSYVYGENNLSGDDPTAVGYDLIYIPKKDELASMIFKPAIFKGWYYGAEDQRRALDYFIDQEPYLRNNRGMYAQRNGSAAPFFHRVDATVQKQFFPKLQHIKLKMTLTFEIINLLGLINSKWSREWLVPGSRVPLIKWEGWADAANAVPQYSFDPGWLNTGLFEPNFQPGNHKTGNWQFQTSLRLSFY